MNYKALLMVTLGLMVAPVTAMASVAVTQGSSAPTYDTTLNFDEAGGPAGFVSSDSWQSIGVSSLSAGDGMIGVADWATDTGQPWIGDSNAALGNFGVFMTFADDVTEMSLQAWDPSGAPSPFGGGMGVFVFNDGVEVANFVGEPAWGGVGDEWYNIVATSGMVFDEVRVVGFGFDPSTFVDNLSWNVRPVPVPGALVLFISGLAGLGLTRRRANG